MTTRTVKNLGSLQMHRDNRKTPEVFLFTGLPGSGKTTHSKLLAGETSTLRVSTEELRAELLGISFEVNDVDFSQDEIRIVYDIMFYITKQTLSSGHSIILDGVFRSEKIRQTFKNLCIENDAKFSLIWVRCAEEVAIERLQKRKAAGSPSPSGPISYQRMRAHFEVPRMADKVIENTNSVEI